MYKAYPQILHSSGPRRPAAPLGGIIPVAPLPASVRGKTESWRSSRQVAPKPLIVTVRPLSQLSSIFSRSTAQRPVRHAPTAPTFLFQKRWFTVQSLTLSYSFEPLRLDRKAKNRIAATKRKNQILPNSITVHCRLSIYPLANAQSAVARQSSSLAQGRRDAQ
jgi:hypothetical protein